LKRDKAKIDYNEGLNKYDLALFEFKVPEEAQANSPLSFWL